MSGELIKYIAEQSGGVLIAIILINHVETKIDALITQVTRLTDVLTAQMMGGNPNQKIAKLQKWHTTYL